MDSFHRQRLWKREVDTSKVGSNRWKWEKQGDISVLGTVRLFISDGNMGYIDEEDGRKMWRCGLGQIEGSWQWDTVFVSNSIGIERPSMVLNHFSDVIRVQIQKISLTCCIGWTDLGGN